jgi:hypothetical protein
VNKCLDLLSNNIPDFLALLSAFVQRAEIDLREAAVGCFVMSVSKLTMDLVTHWFILFEALARAALNNVESVRRMGHAALAATAAMKQSEEVIKNAFDEALPQFFAAANLPQTHSEDFVSAVQFHEKTIRKAHRPKLRQLRSLLH